MSERNDFDLFIGLVLAKLYEERGKSIDLSPINFGLEFDKHSKYYDSRIDVWENTVEWLYDEGYLRYKQKQNVPIPLYTSSVLSEKGFKALNSIPEGIKEKTSGKSVGARLIELGKEAGWNVAKKAGEKGAGEAIGQITDLVRIWFS